MILKNNNQKIKNLRENGFSLREICKKLDLSYSTVQRACSWVEISKYGLKRYTKLNGLKRSIIFKDFLNESKVRIISNLLFDGAVYNNKYHYSIMYVNSSKDLIDQFIKDMKGSYNVKPSTLEDYGRYQRTKYLSRVIYGDLTKYVKSFSTSNRKCRLPNEIVNGNDSFKLIVLKAFWENEGSISNDGKLSADLKSIKVIKQLSKLHDDFGLKHNICKYRDNGWMYKLFLSKTKENYQKFLKLGLFHRANVTKGYNVGKKKVDVLNNYFNKKFNIKFQQQHFSP